MRQIHSIAFDGFADTTDKDDRPVSLHFFYDADMREGIIVHSVSVRIPGIVKEDEVPGLHHRPFMDTTVYPHMFINKPYAVDLAILLHTIVQIDPVSEIYRAGHAGAVMGDATAAAFNRSRSYKLCRCASNSVLASIA